MKNFGRYLTSLLLCVFLLSSCIKGSNVRDGVGYGLLAWGGSNGFTPVLKSPLGIFSGSNVIALVNNLELNVGDCYVFSYRIDYDQPENSASVVETNGYQTITLIDYVMLPTYNFNSYFPDISYISSDEIPLVKACNGIDFFEGYLFMAQVARHPDDWKLTWEINYDPDTMMPTEEDGQRYYDVYVRARAQSKSEKTTMSELTYTNVYYVDDYLTLAANQERKDNPSATQFKVRFFYISDIDEETNTATWSHDQVDFSVEGFLDTASWY